jgi:hypothetical protein
MRNKRFCAFAALSAFVICGPRAAASPHLHRIDGTEIPLHISDSVVSLLFVALPQPLDSSAFAGERPELRDDYPVRNLGGGLYIFGVELGLDIVSITCCGPTRCRWSTPESSIPGEPFGKSSVGASLHLGTDRPYCR